MENEGGEKNKIRNFVIISHIDHGKSTLADRFLEITGTVSAGKMRAQFLDSMDLEREKGITIKMHPCKMNYNGFTLNLIDTPGHIDFSYETSRALACVEGAVLLVDAQKGIQAQTLFNLEMASAQGLKIIGAVNKIDIEEADSQRARKELAKVLNVSQEKISMVSAKKGTNVKNLLEKIIRLVPPPKNEKGVSVSKSDDSHSLKALIFDSKYDPFLGVIVYVRVFSGSVTKGDKIYFLGQKASSSVKEVGYFTPELKESASLRSGEIGYIKTSIKDPNLVRVGDTVAINESLTPLPGYRKPSPVIFLAIYPYDPNQFSLLRESLNKLKLTDPSFIYQPESSSLGRGFRIGFLGSLQAEIILRRLKNEYGLDLISTSPQTIFKIITKKGEEKIISSPNKWPDQSFIKETMELFAKIEIISPDKFFGKIFKVFEGKESIIKRVEPISFEKSIIFGEGPLREIIGGTFYEDLKGATEGYASFSFEITEFKKSDLVKMDILLAGKKEEAFSKIVPKGKAYQEGRKLIGKLKEALPSQQFELAIQAVVGGRVIARESIKARRKDVTAPLYGGDVTRKKKLLEKQKRGKMKLKSRANIRIPNEVYLKVFKS